MQFDSRDERVMADYVLLEGALTDLDHIQTYSIETWGLDIAVAYLEGLSGIFEMIAARPAIGRNRNDDLGNGYISYIYKSHVVYYKISPEHNAVLIVAILHYSMLPAKHLERNDKNT